MSMGQLLLNIMDNKKKAMHTILELDGLRLPFLHSQNTLSLNNYAVTEELKFALHHSVSSVVHTFSSFSTSSFFFLDHFIVNEFLFNRIQCYVTCDEIENQSDHLPLLITLDIELSIVNDVVINPPTTVPLAVQ